LHLYRSVFATVGNVAKDSYENVKVAFSNIFDKRKKRATGCGIGKVVPDVVDVQGINMDKLKDFAKRK
jgi:hypothetical protein